MHPPLVDTAGTPLENQETSAAVNVKRFIFDWSSLVAFVMVVLTWATLAAETASNTREIERLRAANEEHARSDIKIAETMATKADVQRVSDQVHALALELRNTRAVR